MSDEDRSITAIRPLLSKHDVDGSTLQCTFTCPVSKVQHEATATLQQGTAHEIADRAADRMKKSVFYSLRRSIGGAISSLLGGGTAGSIGYQAAGEAVDASAKSKQGDGKSFNESEVDAGIVDAFTSIQDRFRWDGSRWLAAEVASDGE